MTVYIESVIVDNLTMDALILCLVFWTLKEPVPKFRVFLSAAVGTAGACVFPLFALPAFLALLCKIALSVAMVLLVKGRKRTLFYFLLFYAYTFALGGTVVGLFYLVGMDFRFSSGTVEYDLSVPMGFVFGSALLALIGARKLIAALYRRREQQNFVRKVRLIYGDREIDAIGYVDSGNVLMFDNCPVVLAECRTVLRLFGVSDFSELDCHKCRFSYIEISTMSGKKKIPVFCLDRLVADQAEYGPVYCGISFEPLKMSCDVLLNCMTR